MEAFFFLIVLFGIIGRVLFAMAAGRAVQQQFQQLQHFQQLQEFGRLQQLHQLEAFGQAYNAAVEQQILALLRALQGHQPEAAVHHQRVVRQIQTLPAEQRRTYTAKLDDAMSGFELNPRTGAWEETRR
jgi:hypothetical protein